MRRHAIVRTGEDFGIAISEVRRTLGITQAQMAEEVGISRSYLALLESGRTSRVLEHYLRALRRSGATVTVAWDDSPCGTPAEPTGRP